MSDEPTNRHSMKHKIWVREMKIERMERSAVQPGGGDPALKGSDPPDEPKGMVDKLKKIFS